MPIVVTTLVFLALAAEPTPVIQHEIVVTAARFEEPRDQASAAVTVLDREDLERLPANSLAELLAFVPGVTMMFDSGAGGRPMITSRGFFGGGEVEYVKLIVDGVPLGDSESGNVDWQRFRASDIERIEVLHGPGSALYGDAALGGVIQVFTHRGEPGAKGELHLGAGSFGAGEVGATFRADLTSGLRLRANAETWSTEGFREHSDAEGREGRLALEQYLDRWRWRIEGESDRQERRHPGALSQADIAVDRTQSDPFFRFDQQTTTRRRIAATLASSGQVPIRASLYGVHRDDDTLRTLLLAPGFGTSAFRALETDAFGGTFEVSRQWTHGVLRAGLDLERASISAGYSPVTETGRPSRQVAAEDGRRDRAGLFVTGGWSFARRFSVSAGVRHDEIRDDFAADLSSVTTTSSAWSPRVGLNVHLGKLESPVSLFIQLSRAFKAPTFDQLFDQRPYPDGTGGSFTVSNPDLLPQRARNLEVGLARTTSWADWSVALYRMNVRDEIDFDPQTFTYRNIGTSRHRGVEATLAVAKTARVSPRLTYAWTHVVDAAAPDAQLKNIPEHSAGLLLHWRVSPNTSADLGYRWRDSLSLDDAGMFRAPSVSRVDLRFAHERQSLRFQLDILNALDVHYNELGYVLLDFAGQPTALEYPAPGRALRFGVTWTFRNKEAE